MEEDLNAPPDHAPSLPDSISDLLADTAIPIPAPVRRNLLKAFTQLCTAAIDVPAAYLTGKADERRAETTARIKLINVSAAQIAQQMQTDPEYARVAVQKFGSRVLSEQVNLDMITHRAASEIHEGSDPLDQASSEQSSDPINDDWLNAFETEARQKSTAEMQAYFGKVLAGEIRAPGSYSTRTIRILGSLDQSIASLFVQLCSMCISIGGDIRVPSMGGNAATNALEEYGLNFAALNLLNEHGLVISDYNSWFEHVPCRAIPGTENQALSIPWDFQRRHWLLAPISKDKRGKNLRIHGVALTQTGRELFRIVKVERVDDFANGLFKFLESKGFRMIEVSDTNPQVVTVNDGNGS